MNSPSVAVILVNFNNKADTIECIKSLQGEEYKNKKIYVIDNGSADDSCQELRKIFKDEIILIENKENLGFSGANNIGIKEAIKAGCGYFLLLNNDTAVDKAFIKPMIEASERTNSIVCPKILYYDDAKILWSAGGEFLWKKGVTHNLGINEEDKGQFEKEREVEFASGCALFIPRDIFEKVGYLSEDYFLYYEDTDYCLKAKEAGYKIIYTPKAVVYHKVSRTMGGAESETVLYYSNRNRLYFNDKFNKYYKKAFLFYFYITRVIKMGILFTKGEENKAKAIAEGIKDYRRGKIGKR